MVNIFICVSNPSKYNMWECYMYTHRVTTKMSEGKLNTTSLRRPNWWARKHMRKSFSAFFIQSAILDFDVIVAWNSYYHSAAIQLFNT